MRLPRRFKSFDDTYYCRRRLSIRDVSHRNGEEYYEVANFPHDWFGAERPEWVQESIDDMFQVSCFRKTRPDDWRRIRFFVRGSR